MRRGPFIVAGGLLVVLLGVAVAVYLYDSGRTDRIADGVTIGGVDVGGMSRQAARTKLTRALVEPLQHSVRIQLPAGRRPVTLTPDRARLRLDIDSTLATAQRESRDGSILTRTWRDLTGGRLDRQLHPRLDYSTQAVTRTVHQVAARVNRAPVDATVEPSRASLRRVRGHFGVAVRRAALKRGIVRRLTRPHGPNRLRVPTRDVRPNVTSASLGRKYPAYIVIDRKHFKLRLFRHLRIAKVYRIAVGRQGLETPAGLYDVQSKQVNPSWHVPKSSWAGSLAGKVIPPGPQNPLKARWMGFNGGAGIHGTAEVGSLGTAASHGCIRMDVPDVVRLYRHVDVGTPVYVA